MPRVEFDVDTKLPPEKVVAMLTDFSDRRPETWPGLSAEAYKVYSVGETTAEIREGNRSPKVWARERYDWSRTGIVRWTVVESNFSTPGSFVEAQTAPGAEGGTRIHVVWNRTGSTLVGKLVATVVKLSGGAPVRASLLSGLRKAESGEGAAPQR